MKKLFAFICSAVLIASVHAKDFKEGVHYTTLNTTKSNTPLVTEYFSFYCGACAAFEPIIKEIKSKLPEGAKLEQKHMSFMGGAMGKNMSKAFATMNSLKVTDEVKPAMFNQIHQLRRAPKSVQELKAVFVKSGVEAKEFDATFNSFIINSIAAGYDKDAIDAGVRGTPTLVVNNKYRIEREDLKTLDDYLKLVDFLLKK